MFSGQHNEIGRQSAWGTYALTTDVATNPVIDFRGAAGGTVFVPAGSSITSLTWYAAPDPEGDFLPLNDADGAIVQTVEAGKAYDLPAACFGARALKVDPDAAGSIHVSLKG